ncbi:E3 ubiquitin-protein ligase PUB23-like [Humulus lupulus]|uniref:E3 ubiquitin-protein ligase PUB23-like n=1 Tax=Humulus lupulus TaxID=3486 RepID=UPI002B405080|nr:E3 ubiquitin-protein ligase PUB23-like [Humulus lupulus]
MDEIEVPSFFLCPISLEIMKDPVTLSTGITYDRESIEKWLFSGKNEFCPVTKQPIPDSELTPNHTLRRLIQAWCTMNASHGIERIPTPKPPVNKTQIIKLINDAKSPQSQIKCLRRLRSIAAESETNKRCLEAAGAVDFLASLIGNNDYMNHNEENDMSFTEHFARASDEALCILNNLQLSETVLKNLMARNLGLVESLTKVMQRGTCESRVHAVVLSKSLLEVADPMKIIGLRAEFFVELVQVLKDQDQVSRTAFKAALQLLIQLCPWGRNRIKAVEAGAVPVLIELLLETNSSEKRRCVEVAMAVLDLLCGCAEGRAEFLHHSAGLAMVSKKILRVSQVASEKAVRILYSISKFSATTGVLQEMLQLGVVAKLCLVLQVDCGSKTKERAREILKLHARTWKKSPCVPTNLLSSYPA